MIYTTFKQWVRGRFLETGEPRKQAYSTAELDLIEMGWNYGYDAGVQWKKSQQALDKKAENARELGLNYGPEDSLHWHALNYRTASTQNAKSMFEVLEDFVSRQKWVWLTDEEIEDLIHLHDEFDGLRDFADIIQVKLKVKNT